MSLQQAITHQQSGRLQEARELYLALLQQQPHHSQANHNLGVLAVQMHQPANGLSYFMAALDADPACAQYWLSYIDALFQAGQPDVARQILALARRQGLQGDEVEALAARLAYDAALATPQGINALLALINTGRLNEAEVHARTLTEHFPNYGLGWMVRGSILKQLGRSVDALAPMQKAAALLPDDAAAHTNLGAALQDLGRLEEAEASLRKALQLNPNSSQTYSNLGVTLQALGRLNASEQSLRQALALDPENADAHNNLGNVLMGMNRLDEAVISYQRAVQLNPENAATHHNLGSVLHKLARLSEAKDCFRRALAINPESSGSQHLLDDILRQRGALPDYLVPEVFDVSNDRVLQRYFPREASTFIYAIDVAGTCNLRCPSCPVGNFSDAVRPKGFMELEVFRGIVSKIMAERVAPHPKVWLFNWGEPLLHPDLPEMITLLRQNGLRSMLSTNLNIKKNLEQVIRAQPDEIKISLSGFTQELYSQTHTRGNVELVKTNMVLMRELLDRCNARIEVWVGLHLYRHNLHESAAIEQLCQLLKFDYRPIPAFFQPLEKMMNLIEGRATQSETELLANLLEHPLAALASKQPSINPGLDCELRFNMTTINYDGSVALCCSVYDQENMLGVNFLDASHDEIQALKYRHPTCKKCYGYGLQYSEPLPEPT